jgi:hypothetical protein
MIDLIKATAELYGDCSQEVNSTDIYIKGVLATAAQMMAINAKADANLVVDSKTGKIKLLTQAYNTAIQQPVAFMLTTFQADTASQQVLTKSLVAGSVPTGFYWLDSDNNKVTMTYAQLQGLAGAMLLQGQLAFDKLQTKKAAVIAATTKTQVEAVVW